MAAEALFGDLHESRPFHDGTEKSWAKKRSRSHPYHYSEGVTIFAAPFLVDPDDDFLSGTPAADDDPDGGGVSGDQA